MRRVGMAAVAVFKPVTTTEVFRMRLGVRIAAFCIMVLPAVPARAQPIPLPQAWDTAYVVLLERNAEYRPASEAAAQDLFQRHLQYQLRLIAEDHTIRGGPLVQEPNAAIVGISVLRARSKADAEALAHADPAVREGLMRATVRVWTTPAAVEARPADPADVATIDGIMRAFYDVINGPPGQPRQWERDRTLYMPGAMFVSVSERDGRTHVTRMTPQEYRLSTDSSFVADGSWELETGSRVERWGNLAQVRSIGEFRRTPDGPLVARYVNYVHLYCDGSRWWVAGAIWEPERPGAAIPPAWRTGREVVADDERNTCTDEGR
jgi:uncharacterized protein YciI